MIVRRFDYLPTGHVLSIDRSCDHEYFGEEFKTGKMHPALFRNERTRKLYVVWTYGSWRAFRPECGKTYLFQHTQNRRTTELQFLGSLTWDTKLEADVYVGLLPVERGRGDRVTHWTLK